MIQKRVVVLILVLFLIGCKSAGTVAYEQEVLNINEGIDTALRNIQANFNGFEGKYRLSQISSDFGEAAIKMEDENKVLAQYFSNLRRQVVTYNNLRDGAELDKVSPVAESLGKEIQVKLGNYELVQPQVEVCENNRELYINFTHAMDLYVDQAQDLVVHKIEIEKALADDTYRTPKELRTEVSNAISLIETLGQTQIEVEKLKIFTFDNKNKNTQLVQSFTILDEYFEALQLGDKDFAQFRLRNYAKTFEPVQNILTKDLSLTEKATIGSWYEENIEDCVRVFS